MRVRHEHQLPGVRRAESLHIANGHMSVSNVDLQDIAVCEPGFFLQEREPGVAEAVDGDDAGLKRPAPFPGRPYLVEAHQGGGAHTGS